MNLLEQAQQLTLREAENQLTQSDFDWQRCNDIIENLIIEKAKQGECEILLQNNDNVLNTKNIPRLYYKYLEYKYSIMNFKCNMIERKINEEYMNDGTILYSINFKIYLKISWN